MRNLNLILVFVLAVGFFFALSGDASSQSCQANCGMDLRDNIGCCIDDGLLSECIPCCEEGRLCRPGQIRCSVLDQIETMNECISVVTGIHSDCVDFCKSIIIIR